MNRQMNDLFTYYAPEIEVIEVDVEHGFSNSIEDPIENDDMDW